MANKTQRAFGTQLEGFSELRTVLRTLPAEVENSVLTQAVEAGGKIVHRSAVANVRRQTGALSNALRMEVTKQSRGRMEAKARIAVEKNYKRGGRRPVRYAHLLEFGHKSAKGFVPPQPFLRPAIVNNRSRITNAIAVVLKQGIHRAAKKVGNK